MVRTENGGGLVGFRWFEVGRGRRVLFFLALEVVGFSLGFIGISFFFCVFRCFGGFVFFDDVYRDFFF